MQLTEISKTVLEARYLWKDSIGVVRESPDELVCRVATAVAQAERPRDRRKWEDRFVELIGGLRFLPNSPTLMNAGKPKGQLSACFVLPISDSLGSIFETLKLAAKIHQSGGGTGFAFSTLRPGGSAVRTTRGIASGPVSFIRIYDMTTEVIKQGGARRGANMAILRADHPDIEEFVDAKRDGRSIVNFNLSVGATDEFMAAVEAGADFALRDVTTGKPVRTVPARGLFERIADAAWTCGDPGLVFLDRVNLFNPTPELGRIDSTNPCGEQPLLPFESCNLGSLSVGSYVSAGEIDWEALRRDVRLSVRFLDDVIDVNVFPVGACGKITRANRKIGLGVMGFADLLLELGLPYGSERARALGERVMSFIDREAKLTSALLADEKGAFPNWRGSLWSRLGYPPLRNATVSTVAPTGTISMIAGVSSGIEPIFAARFVRNVLDGRQLEEVHPEVRKALEQRGIPASEVSDAEAEKALGPAWSPARAVAVEDHVRMQAVFQRHSDSAVSKTVNLPGECAREDVARTYQLAYRLGCKGITIYRDRSRLSQVLESRSSEYCPSC